jgi:PAS domain S-box-containing protein
MTDRSVETEGPAVSAARILIVDDEQRILDEYAYVLGRPAVPSEGQRALDDLEAELFGQDEPAQAGDEPIAFEVMTCRQGQDAIVAVEQALRCNKPFSVVFLDVRMPPGIDGVTTAERIRAVDASVNIVFVTGYSDVRPEAMADRVPPPDKMIYCQKPLQASELKQFARALSAKWLAEQRLRAVQARLHQLITSTSVVIYSSKPNGLDTTFISANVHEQFGFAPEDFLNDGRLKLNRVHPSDVGGLTEHLGRLPELGEITYEYRFRRADGEYRWVTDQMKLLRGGDGEPLEVVGCCLDVSERRHAEERIRYLAYFDSLTGLPNRTFMREVLDFALANAVRHQRQVAVLFLDIDHFKRINDTLGHDAGDALLREVAQRLQDSVRASDQVARQTEVAMPDLAGGHAVSRLGGDEFVVILSEIASADAASRVAQRIADTLTTPVRLAHDEITVTTSIGISLFPKDGADAEKILKHADAAMYSAKENGRNQHRFFTEELNERASRRFSLETRLRRALERNEFLLHYQPRMDIKSRRVIGMEALLRWQQPDVGLVSPLEFIPIAEELGLIVPIGEWVLGEACRQTTAWRRADLPALTVSVNLSAMQFKSRRLPKTIAAILAAAGLPPANLELELTESMLVEDTEASAAMLAQLKEIGLKLSIDDFGTGYSSLAYLKRFPLDALKIDRSFVRDITSDKNDAAIVSATIGLAHNLNLRVVAEGVEQQVQVDILRAQGCDEAQGYLFSRPLPAPAFESWIRESAGASAAAGLQDA